VVESINLDSNFRFDICVIYLQLIIFLVVGDIFINNEVFFDRLYES
jgi:hypothetical protein